MTRAAALAVALLAACAAGCAGARPAPPSDPRHGVLHGRLVVRGALLRFLKDEAVWATAVQLDARGGEVPGVRAVSGLARDGRFYMLDVPPGRYALTSASFRKAGVRRRVAVPGEPSKRSVVLEPGQAAFLGDFELDAVLPEQGSRLARVLGLLGRWLTPWVRRPAVPLDAELKLADTGPDAQSRSLLAARENLAGTPWARLIESRIRRVGVAEAPPVEGFVRRRPVEPKQEKTFGWRDTLGWGEPARRGAAGCEWRRPGGTARIAVYFTTSTAAGFAGYEAAVRELRTLESVEDLGGLAEVRVSTRVGVAGRSTKWIYPEGTLTGSVARVVVTETVLVPDGWGVYTARLRADKDEFAEVVPAFREFLEQLALGPPKKKEEPQDPVLLLP